MLKSNPVQTTIYRSLIVIVILILSLGNLFAQYNYNYKTFNNDFEKIIKQPTKWDKNDWLKIIGTAALTYGTMYVDGVIRETVFENNRYKYSVPVEFGRIWGEGYTAFAIGGITYIHGLATGNSKNKKIGFEIGESALYTGLITILLKYGFGRERPRKNSNPFSFYPFTFQNSDFQSLSSGHTAMAFSLSAVLAKNTSNNYLKVILFVPAFMTAFSRVYQNHHWVSDVILGGIIGYSVAEFVTCLHSTISTINNTQVFPQTPIKLIDFRIPL